MKNFANLSKVEQHTFSGAQFTYSEPPVVSRTDVVWMTARDNDGDWISGLFAPGDPNNDLCVIHFYGNNETLRASEYVIDVFRSHGISVLIFDYRGYGSSRGKPRESSFYADAELVYEWLRERHPHLRIVVSGWFLGSAVATYLAQTADDVNGLILFSAPTTMVEVVRHVFPPDQIIIEEAMPFQFDTLERIRRVKCPILLVHGKNDIVVPYSMSDELEAAAKSPLSRYDVPGAGHRDLFATGGEALWSRVFNFVESL
jgi:fermentation-respiration switch protein FrsA (DUF1100 family)